MTRPAAVVAAIATAAMAVAGCGDRTSIVNGGRIPGETLTVYSLLPRNGPAAAASHDAVLGEKLALAQANGRVGPLTVNYVALDLPAGKGTEAIASTVRDAIHDTSIAAVIGDFSSATARTTAPLFNAAGILQLSPSAADPALLDDPRYEPSGRRTLAPLLPGDAQEAAALADAAHGPRVAIEATAGTREQGLAEAVRGRLGRTVGTAHADTVIVLAADVQDATAVVDGVLRENRHARVLLPQALWTTGLPERLRGRSRVWFITPAGPPSPTLRQAFTRTFGEPAGPYAQIGYDAMRSVLDTIRRAGARAGNREHLIRTYFAGDGAGAAARRPWWLAQRTTDGGTRYARVTR